MVVVATGACITPTALAQPLTVTSRSGYNLVLCGPPGLVQQFQNNFNTGTNTDDLLDIAEEGSPTWPASHAASHLTATVTPTSLSLHQGGQAGRGAFGAYADAHANDSWTFTIAAPTCFTFTASIESTDVEVAPTLRCFAQITTAGGLFHLSDGSMATYLGGSLSQAGAWSTQRSGTMQPGTYTVSMAGNASAANIPAYFATYINSLTLLVDTAACGPTCDPIDFNNDGLFPDTADIDDFLSVFSGGPCSTGTCGDIDFNNDGLFPDTADIDAFISVFSGGQCL
jgi:hypothetical protein